MATVQHSTTVSGDVAVVVPTAAAPRDAVEVGEKGTVPFLLRQKSEQSPAVSVLHIINGEHYAGAERVQDLLGQQLPNFGYQPGFACLKAGQFAAMRKSADTPLYDSAMTSRIEFLGGQKTGKHRATRGLSSAAHAHGALCTGRLRRLLPDGRANGPPRP